MDKIIVEKAMLAVLTVKHENMNCIVDENVNKLFESKGIFGYDIGQSWYEFEKSDIMTVAESLMETLLTDIYAGQSL